MTGVDVVEWDGEVAGPLQTWVQIQVDWVNVGEADLSQLCDVSLKKWTLVIKTSQSPPNYLEVSVHGEVLEVNLDSESTVVTTAVWVVEPGDPGDVEVDHVLLHLLSDVVTIPGAVPWYS